MGGHGAPRIRDNIGFHRLSSAFIGFSAPPARLS
jgi:hypothetical protein